MTRSLLDRADLVTIRRAARRYPGPFATVVACLVDGRLLQYDPDDPDWSDRDRLVAGDPDAERAAASALSATGATADRALVTASPGVALALATGAALASGIDGGIFRVWCLLGSWAVSDGLVWEGARAAVAGETASLSVVAVARANEAERIAALFAAAGWLVRRAAATDAIEMLGALDHTITASRRPVLVLGIAP